MFEKLGECPVCQSSDIRNEQIVKDHSISKEDFALVRCSSCGFLFTNPRPAVAQLDKYYQSEEYISHQNKANTIVNWVYSLARRYTLQWKYKITSSYVPSGSALDIGCGTGHFLKTLQNKGWSISGVEPDATARNYARTILSEKHISSTLDEIQGARFDIITMWHVLEHVSELHKYMQKLKVLLNKKGKLFVAVPNHRSLDAKIYDTYWAGYDTPRHLYHFDQNTMKLLAKRFDFKIIDTIPMKLDAYYVSLLSEKYKGSGLMAYPKSFINAYKSNSYGKKSGNYSSLIFVLAIK